MSQYQSFFISASGNSSQCDEINHFLRSHVVIRTVENIINSGSNCGIQILVEYKDVQQPGEKNGRQKIDWRASLATDEQRELFDRLKEFRAKFSKEKHLVGAYMVCKDEHLASIVQNPDITLEEIKSLPHLNNIMLKDFAEELFSEYQKICSKFFTQCKQKSSDNTRQNDCKSPCCTSQ